jgi:hypothetical protein
MKNFPGHSLVQIYALNTLQNLVVTCNYYNIKSKWLSFKQMDCQYNFDRVQGMQFIKSFGSKRQIIGRLNDFIGIDVDTDGNIAVSDGLHRRIQTFDKSKLKIGKKLGYGKSEFFKLWHIGCLLGISILIAWLIHNKLFLSLTMVSILAQRINLENRTMIRGYLIAIRTENRTSSSVSIS